MEPPLVVQAAAVAVVGGTRYLGSLPELGCAPTPCLAAARNAPSLLPAIQ